MNNRQPITPPPELAQTLWNEMRNAHHEDIPCSESWNRAIAKAYQAGADMELEACCEWLGGYTSDHMAIYFLRDARRPKLPSETDLALETLNWMESEASYDKPMIDPIRRCLERLKKLEESTND